MSVLQRCPYYRGRDPLQISLWGSQLFFFSFPSFLPIPRCYFQSVLKNILSIISVTRCKKKNTTTMTVQFALKLVFLGRSTELKLSSISVKTRKLIKLGFPLCEMNSKLDFSEKRRGFDRKSQTETHSGESYCATNELVCKVRCTEKNALVSRFLLLFWSYRPKFLQCFLENTSAVNISSQDHFLITRTGKKAVNSRVVATSLLGNFGYQINRKKDLRQPIFLRRFL